MKVNENKTYLSRFELGLSTLPLINTRDPYKEDLLPSLH
jgi:DNA-directed RNA polymerase subunit H (RpoH/RPB5)